MTPVFNRLDTTWDKNMLASTSSSCTFFSFCCHQKQKLHVTHFLLLSPLFLTGWYPDSEYPKWNRDVPAFNIEIVKLFPSCLFQDKVKRAELELDEEKSSVEIMTDRVARSRDQIDQLRSELMQERSSKQDLELDKNAMERHVHT